jgi:serine/threonine-protein kinase
MDTCRTCHREAAPQAKFCAHCGTVLAATASTDHPHDPFLGRTLKGVYLIQEKIGDGGMGLVYKALHLELEAPFAVKILRNALLTDPGVVGRFQREARAASRLRHPNVVTVTDFGQTEDGVLFMVMEHVPGRSLAWLIADGAPLPERRVVHIGAQILSALAEAHASQILHRDLKPENVMVEARRETPDSVKVLDFGIAKVLMEATPSTVTRAGLVMGTPGYMSPEQLTGDDLDVRSDLYAVGVVLYEMLSGKLPYAPKTPVHLARLQMTEAPAPPSSTRARPVSRELEALVLRALAPLREDRPQTADEMRAHLLACPVEAEDVADGRSELLERLSRGSDVGWRPGQPMPTPRPPGQGIDPKVLEAVERRALLLLGPLAPVLLRKASATSSTIDELIEKLASFVPSEKERKALLDAFRAPQPTPSATPVASRTPARVAWDPGVLDRLQRQLAVYIGPVARVVVQRACARAVEPRELHEIVAREIASDAERASFLASVGGDATGQ